jgi:hypothetical protein
MNILLLRYYLLNSREKFDIIKKTDLQWEYHELANISNLVLKSNTFLKQSNKDSIAISKLLKNKCYVYISQNQCDVCLVDAIDFFSKYNNSKLIFLINYNDKVWLEYIINKYSLNNYYYSMINIFEDDIKSMPFTFTLSNNNMITNPFIITKNEFFNRTCLDIIIKSIPEL